jgi:hypothetical protein
MSLPGAKDICCTGVKKEYIADFFQQGNIGTRDDFRAEIKRDARIFQKSSAESGDTVAPSGITRDKRVHHSAEAELHNNRTGQTTPSRSIHIAERQTPPAKHTPQSGKTPNCIKHIQPGTETKGLDRHNCTPFGKVYKTTIVTGTSQEVPLFYFLLRLSVTRFLISNRTNLAAKI